MGVRRLLGRQVEYGQPLMAKLLDLNTRRKKTNKQLAREQLVVIQNAIETAKRALKALYEKKKLCERILEEE